MSLCSNFSSRINVINNPKELELHDIYFLAYPIIHNILIKIVTHQYFDKFLVIDPHTILYSLHYYHFISPPWITGACVVWNNKDLSTITKHYRLILHFFSLLRGRQGDPWRLITFFHLLPRLCDSFRHLVMTTFLQMCSLFYWCDPIFTDVFPYLLMCSHIYWCVPIFTDVFLLNTSYLFIIAIQPKIWEKHCSDRKYQCQNPVHNGIEKTLFLLPLQKQARCNGWLRAEYSWAFGLLMTGLWWCWWRWVGVEIWTI